MSAVEEARRALRCLHLEAPPTVVADVTLRVEEALAEAWDTGHAAAKGYDLSHELDRQEWEEEFALVRTTNPYREAS